MSNFSDNHATVLALCLYMNETLGTDEIRKYLADVKLAQNNPPEPDGSVSVHDYHVQLNRVNFMVEIAEAMLEFAEQLDEIKARHFVQFGVSVKGEETANPDSSLMRLTADDLKSFTV